MSEVQRGLQPNQEVMLLQVYLHELGYLRNVDGSFGSQSVAALRRFQSENDLVVDGVAGEKTWTRLFALRPELVQAISAKWLSQQDLEETAAQESLPLATVKAVYQVESGGNGFWGLNPKILFEGHVFWKRLRIYGKNPIALQPGYEDVLYPKWDKRRYVGGLAEYARLEKAQQLDLRAALESTSWGLFQILGYHATDLGYGSVEAFVEQMRSKERAQLDAFCRFIEQKRFEGQPLLHWLQAQDWTRFAKAYNGASYSKNQYDKKLKAAYSAAEKALSDPL